MRHHKGQHSPHHSSPGHPHKSHHASSRNGEAGHPHNAKGDGSESDWGYASGKKLHVTKDSPIDGDGALCSHHELQHADYSELTGGYSTE